MNISDGDGVQTIIWSDGSCEVAVRIEGTVTFSTDFTAIQAITPGGLVRIREDGGGSDRQLEIRPASDGTLEYTYRVAGRDVAFADGGREWLTAFIPELLRNSGLAAEERAAWFLRTQGTAGLLAEVVRVRGDRSQRRYLMVSVESEGLSAQGLAATLGTAGQELESDRELAALLMRASGRDLTSATSRRAFLDATAGIQSDREHRRVLEALLGSGPLALPELSLLLESSLSISSDRELASLLELVLEQGPVPAGLRDAFMRSLDTISSDREYGRVAQALLQSGRGAR